MQPTGWFQVAWSSDLEVGDIKPLTCFGTELVAFRDLDGAVRVLDAHCQHLGADLSRGGCVVEGGIQCPFHGWVWSGDGRNVRIPYESRPVDSRQTRAWPVTELNECIYIWHDLNRRDPLWPVPDAWELLAEQGCSQFCRSAGPDEKQYFPRVRVHPQVIAEHSVDRNHFRFVHHTPVRPTVLAEMPDESTWHARVCFGTRDTIEIYWWGIGLSLNVVHGADGVQAVAICPTPVDESTTDIFATYWISESLDYDERLRVAKLALPDDIGIWQHQRPLDHPGLAPSEAADFVALRSWAGGFYPQTHLKN
jgi:3-ketosteroid 9alpha-monooxygenase subunit A